MILYRLRRVNKTLNHGLLTSFIEICLSKLRNNLNECYIVGKLILSSIWLAKSYIAINVFVMAVRGGTQSDRENPF